MAVTPEALSEQMLVIRSQIGDETAFQELLKLHGPRLLLFTQRMMQSSPEQVADVMQEIGSPFIACTYSASSFGFPSSSLFN